MRDIIYHPAVVAFVYAHPILVWLLIMLTVTGALLVPNYLIDAVKRRSR